VLECVAMKILKAFLLVSSAAMAACASSPAATPLGPAATESASGNAGDDGWRVLVDFDHPPQMPSIAEHDKILEKLVGAHRHDPKECAGDGPKTIASLQGGIEGAFTAVGVKETAYLLTTASCDDPPGVDKDKHRLIVMSADKVALDKEITEHVLVAVKDLDSDGDNEIVVMSGRKADPAGSFSARVVDTEGGQLAEMFDFGELAWTRCAGDKKTLQSATILYRVKGTSLEYKADKRQRPCP
jgi:hypothetical protein